MSTPDELTILLQYVHSHVIALKYKPQLSLLSLFNIILTKNA